MELLEGGEIFSRFPRSALSLEEIKHLVRTLLQAVSELQERKLVHRDLKPGNIMLKYPDRNLLDNNIKLIDFGLSSAVDGTGYNIMSVCGTPGFIAPEIATLTRNQVEELTPEVFSNCDVFSVGSILFYLLTGDIPFKGQSFEEVLASNKKCEIDWEDKTLQKMDLDAKDFLKKLLERDHS
jgi:serine/threonine protein kinase